jgi:tRNA (5-methylaminomethyl-2-thiouridylate)-methyltransferase
MIFVFRMTRDSLIFRRLSRKRITEKTQDIFCMRIAMLISGGVDSSVALRLLRETGHDVHAFYMKIWLEDELAFLGECPWEEDLKYVRAVCEAADVPLEVVPFQKEYWERVVSETLSEVRAGRTPNPDMLCNSRIKFGAFFDAFGKNFEKIATGHYAQMEERSEKTWLTLSADSFKDQTYFLSQLSQAQVSRACFPIGHLEKSVVRGLARRYQLPNATRKDSQGICFLGKIAFDGFLEYHLGKQTGSIIDWKTGKKLGEHQGFWYYTIGQRQGIGLSGGPWYVVEKKPETNEIFVSNYYRSEGMRREAFTVSAVNWISGKPSGRDLQVKIRHGEKLLAAHLELHRSGDVSVHLSEPEKGIAPGQYAVFYEGKYCLGGGVIG